MLVVKVMQTGQASFSAARVALIGRHTGLRGPWRPTLHSGSAAAIATAPGTQPVAQSSPGFATPGSGPTQYRIDPGLQDLPSIPFLYFLSPPARTPPPPTGHRTVHLMGLGDAQGPILLPGASPFLMPSLPRSLNFIPVDCGGGKATKQRL